MATLLDQLTTILRRKIMRGERYAALSPENLAVLGRRPAAPRPPQPAATFAPPAPPQPAATFAPPAQPQPQPQPPSPQPLIESAYPPPPDVREAGWDELHAACMNCRSCNLCRTRRNVVFEDGLRTAPLMFIGEGPGADEDAKGVPFVGRAGQLLTGMIKAMGRDRASQDPATAVYIANIVKCRPPNNRNPAPEEAGPCLGYLHRQIALVRPKVIVLLGAVPLGWLMQKTGIMRQRGHWLEYAGIPVMPTFHPAYLLRLERFPKDFHDNKLLVWKDLQQVMQRLKE